MRSQKSTSWTDPELSVARCQANIIGMNPRIVVAKTTAISVASRLEMLLVLLLSGAAGTTAYILLALLVSNKYDTLPLLPFRGPYICGSYSFRISLAQISVVNTFKTIKTSNSASYPRLDISKTLLYKLIFKALE